MIDIEKMSRKETIRALRACNATGSCKNCPLYESPPDYDTDCFTALVSHAADVLEASVSVQYE